MIIFYFILQVEAVRVISNFPDIYLYANEMYHESITNYFSGTEIAVKVNEPNSSHDFFFECSTNSSIERIQFIEFPNNKSSHYRLKAIESTFNFTILALNNENVILLSISKFSQTLQVTFNQTLEESYSNVSIRSGVLTKNNLIVLIERTEKVNNYEFRRKDILYAGYENSTLQISSGFWDLRYKEDILMSTTDSDYIAFAVQNEGDDTGGIYVYNFTEPEIPILVQVIDKFKYIPTNVSDGSFPKIYDLLIQNNYLLLLTSDNLTIVFKFFNNSFVELSYTSFKEFGQVNNLAHFKNYYNYIPVTASNFTVVYNVDLQSKLTFSSSRVQGAEVTFAQELAGFLFFSSTTYNNDAYFEIVSYSYNSTQNVTLVNMSNYVGDLNQKGSWIMIRTLFDYLLIRQDYDGIRLFNLKLPSYIFQVSSPKSVQLTITASDIFSSVSNTMKITIYNDLGKIYNVTYYFKPDIERIAHPVYFLSASQSREFDIYNLFSGWNLTYSIGNCTSNSTYEYTVEAYNDFVNWTQIGLDSDIVDAGYYGGILYLRDSKGYVYRNKTKLDNESGALAMLPLSDSTSNIAILYSDFVICYFSQADTLLNVTLVNPCKVFKVSEYAIICAGNNSVQIMSCYQLSVQVFLDPLDGPIKDIAYCDYSLNNVSFLYILMDFKVLIYELLQSTPKLVETKYIESHQIFCYFEHVALLSPKKLEIYSLKLEYRLDFFDLYTTFTHFLIDQHILILQNQDSIYYYNLQSTALNSLVSIYNIGPCSIKSSNSKFLLTNCTSYLNIFNTSCPPSCNKISELNFSLTNIDDTTQGVYSLLIPVSVSNGTETQHINIPFSLITYDIALFFDNSNMQYNYSYSYNIESMESLKYYINGYNVDAVLSINNEVQTSTSVQPVSLVNRLTLQYNYTFNQTVTSYAIIPETDIMIFIINGGITILDQTGSNEKVEYDLGSINGSCIFVEYVARTENLTLVLCYGVQYNTNNDNYYDGFVDEFTQVQPFLAFFTFDIEGLYLLDFQLFFINFNPRLIKVVSGTQNEFAIVFITSKSYIYQDFFNDDIIVYRCLWKPYKYNSNYVTIKREFFINFFTLGLETFAVISVDGIFNILYDKKETHDIFLFVADISFGIRVIRIANEKIKIVQEIELVSNPPVSVTVCSVNLFVVTVKTSLIIYRLDSDFRLTYYVTYPGNSVNKYVSVNSVSTCSSYYTPKYFSFFLQEKNFAINYILRIISLTSDFNSSVHKDIPITGFSSNLIRPTSFFNYENNINFFSNNLTTFNIYQLNDFSLVFNSMNKSQYNQMLKDNKNSDKFNFSITVFKDNHASRTSSYFNLSRTGISSNSISSKEVNYTYIIVGCTCGVFVILVSISFCVYKRIMKKKKIKPEVGEVRFKLQTLSRRVSAIYLVKKTDFNS